MNLRTAVIDRAGCALTYDVRGDLQVGVPLVVFGSPMAADGFGALANQFTDRAIVTFDPRGAGRSPRTDGALRNTVDEHADDLAAVIGALGVHQVDLFASSGGALNALVLAQRNPSDVRTLIAHEPPINAVLPDRHVLDAAAQLLEETYQQRGFGAAMALFLRIVMFEGPFPADFCEQPLPEPAQFGLPTEDDGNRDDPLLGLNAEVTRWVPDLAALRSASCRIVFGVSADSGQGLPGRAATAMAQALDLDAVEFPSHHGGFGSADDPMMPGDPEGFSAVLRQTLDRESHQSA
ncbi:alpha/beta fold hydrolase [Demetria terragena]|uniref:alpha/beta fold hydrolase n=1 Tax=Demetria terragena TaxID=63959 RepID=UPI000373CE2D|nr:alpha/beta hydrolase [Demetria terragena]